MSAGDDLDLTAAALRADGPELTAAVEVMAAKLEQALPGRARVERRGRGLLGREKRVRNVRVELGANRYELLVDGDRLEGFRQRQVGGVSIKREQLAPEEWLAALTADLGEEATRSAEARSALERLLA